MVHSSIKDTEWVGSGTQQDLLLLHKVTKCALLTTVHPDLVDRAHIMPATQWRGV